MGIRVEPPTRRTISISLFLRPESLVHASHGALVLIIMGPTSCSSFDLDNCTFRCLGPVWSAVIKGRFTSVCTLLDSSIFAVSAASRSRCTANLSWLRSMPCAFLNSATRCSRILWSRSSPPREVSPFVAFTSKTPPEISRIEMSKVPPPKSKTAMVWPSFASMPKASAAAVGSLMIRSTSSPAILPASLVAWRWESLKYAGTVITAWLTSPPR
mmetsp:Transcript_89283/g.198427  ORF Transcript_89283/g.198427 Transcript_89283/m.198427 type:complete len:214 (+) Transcript_89283:1116-1757(+)